MTQDGIINNIINTCGIKGFNNSTTQTDVQYLLVTDAMKNPTQYQDQEKYSSVIIILMYVTNKSCQNLAFSVQQCTKTNHNSKDSHDNEVLSICRYLQCNINDGKSKVLVIRHSSNMAVDSTYMQTFLGYKDHKTTMTQSVSNQELYLR